MENIQNRRVFLKKAAAASAGVAIGMKTIGSANVYTQDKAGPICAFTKCLQFLEIGKMGEFLAGLGFEGADLTVRKGGQILPENIASDLPKAVRLLNQSGIQVPMIVTDVIDPDDPETERILGVAAQNGVKHYRTGYLNYDIKKTVPQNLEEHKRLIEKLEKINRKYNIHGAYQNHSGTRVGGPVWDLYWLIKDCDPAFLGVQYDIRHAVCEGGISWPVGMKLLSPWIRTVDVKDFFWKKVGDNWKITNVPLGEGMVDFDAWLKQYVTLGITGPVSMHFEYDLGGAEAGKANPGMGINEIAGFLKGDLTFLQSKFKLFGLR